MIVIVVIVIITVSVVVEVIVIILSERGSGCGGWCDREARLMMRRRKKTDGGIWGEVDSRDDGCRS